MGTKKKTIEFFLPHESMGNCKPIEIKAEGFMFKVENNLCPTVQKTLDSINQNAKNIKALKDYDWRESWRKTDK